MSGDKKLEMEKKAIQEKLDNEEASK